MADKVRGKHEFLRARHTSVVDLA